MSAVDSRGQPLKVGDKVDRHGNAGTITAMGKTDNMVVVTFDNGSRTYVQDTDRELVKKGSKMATRKATKKAPTRRKAAGETVYESAKEAAANARPDQVIVAVREGFVIRDKSIHRKAAEDDEVPKDLDDPGNPTELKSEGDDVEEEVKDEAPFDPKHSALEAAKAHGNLKAIKNYFGEGGEGDLTKMDHPGMRDGLKELLDDGGPVDKAMKHLKDLISEHHSELGDPDEAMEKMCKSLEGGDAPIDKGVEQLENGEPTTELKDDAPLFEDDAETKDDSFPTGEDNLVASGAIPEGDLEPEKDESVDDTEEILERYQNPKTGKRETRKAGVAWRAKNGRVYVNLAPAVRKGPGDVCPFCNGAKINPGTGSTCQACQGTGKDPAQGPVKDLTDTGNPAELKSQPTDEGLDAIGKAADHLDAAAEHAETPPMHKSAHAYHAKALRKALDDMGNEQELKDDAAGAAGGTDLTTGVEELKDADEEEVKAIDDEDETKRAKAKKSLSPNVSRVLEDLRAGRQELTRKARMNGLLN